MGFIIAPWAVRSIIGSRLVSDRLARLRLKVVGGMSNLLTGHAPYSEHAFEYRRDFYNYRTSGWMKFGPQGLKISLGNFSTRLVEETSGDENVLGQHIFWSPWSKCVKQTHHELLLETCHAVHAVIANILREHLPENQMTCYGPGAKPFDDISHAGLTQINHCLADCMAMANVVDVWSDRLIPLQSRHFVLKVCLAMGVGQRKAKSEDIKMRFTTVSFYKTVKSSARLG